MIAFPRRGLTMSKTGDIVTIKMTDDPDSSDFEYMAHRRGDTQKDVFYIGAYLGYVADNKLRSLSGKTPQQSGYLSNFRTWAHNLGTPDGNGGSGYEELAWYQVVFIQAMYVLKYKNLNSQAITRPNNRLSTPENATTNYTSGLDNTIGLESHNNLSSAKTNKLFGIEGLYDIFGTYIDGWRQKGSSVYTGTDNFNDNATGYLNWNVTLQSFGGWWWITKVYGDTHKGFYGMGSSGGSATTYYCDSEITETNKDSILCMFHNYGDTYSGIFNIWNESAYTTANNHYTMGRLMYL